MRKLNRYLFAVLLAILPASSWATATGTYAPNPVFTGFDTNGNPVPGGKLFIYTAGTSTKATTWSDVAMSSANANPLILDSAGRGTVVLLPGASYKFVLSPSTDTDPPVASLWTRDNVSSVPPGSSSADSDVSATAGENLSALDAVILSDGSGGNTAGRWYKCDADQTYLSNAAPAVGFATAAITTGSTGTVRVAGRMTGLSGLVAGTAYYCSATGGALTSSKPTNGRLIAMSDSTTTAIVLDGMTDASSTVSGIVTSGTQTIAGAKTFSTPPVFNPGTASTADATVSGRVNSTYADVGNVGAGEDNLMTYSLSANALSADGKAVRVTAFGTYANNGNAKSVKLYFGTTGGTAIGLTAGQAGNWRLEALIIRTGAATQRMIVTLYSSSSAGVGPIHAADYVTPAESLSGAVTIKCTGTGVADNDLVQKGMVVEVIG